MNKRSVILDLEQRQDQERFRALAAQSDVVVSTEGMAAWAARGIDVERLSKLYPRLVWTSFSLFGLSGPYSAYTGNNIVAEAMGGLMYIQGDDARPPCVSPYEQGLYLASLHAACGTLLALWERRASGLGQVVEVCVHEVLANLYFLLVNYGLWSDMPYRIGARNFMPPNGYYRCQDGHVFIAALQTRQWDRLVELVDDPRLARCRLAGCGLPQRVSRTGGADAPGIHGALSVLAADARTPAPWGPGRTVVDRGRCGGECPSERARLLC